MPPLVAADPEPEHDAGDDDGPDPEPDHPYPLSRRLARAFSVSRRPTGRLLSPRRRVPADGPALGRDAGRRGGVGRTEAAGLGNRTHGVRRRNARARRTSPGPARDHDPRRTRGALLSADHHARAMED